MENSTIEFIENKDDIKHNFRLYMAKKYPELKQTTIDTFFSDGIFLTNNNLGLDFWDTLCNENLINTIYRKKLEEWFSSKKLNSSPKSHAQTYVNAILKIREFVFSNEYILDSISEEGCNSLMELTENKVFTEQKDFTLSNIRELYMDGDIIPNPDYQRDYVYSTKQASKLIESIIMGIPIPSIYFSEEDDGTYTVIDGQQRITSFVKYLNNEFILSGLTELSFLNGKYYKDLDKPIQIKLKTSTLKTICLLKESKELKYEIFARLNQGAVSLKPQELRNCIYRGTFNNMLDDIVKTNKNLAILFYDENKRKTYQERILRFFALRDFVNYKSSILKTMNEYMSAHQNDDDLGISKAKSLYNGTIDIVKQVLGNDAFCTYEREKKQMNNKFSGSVYDSIVIPFSFYNKHDLIKHSDEIRDAITDLKENNTKYQEDIYAATGSRKRVIGRVMAVYNLLAKIIGSYGDPGSDRLFSNSVKEELFYEGYICSYCNNQILNIEDCEVDHIVPFSQGGQTDISNAQLLHRYCNRMKSDSIVEEWEDDENSSD